MDDAVGGAVKQTRKTGAKRRHINNQILTPLDLFNCAKYAIKKSNLFTFQLKQMKSGIEAPNQPQIEAPIQTSQCLFGMDIGTREPSVFQLRAYINSLRAVSIDSLWSRWKLVSQWNICYFSLALQSNNVQWHDEIDACVAVVYEDSWWLCLVKDITMKDLHKFKAIFARQPISVIWFRVWIINCASPYKDCINEN